LKTYQIQVIQTILIQFNQFKQAQLCSRHKQTCSENEDETEVKPKFQLSWNGKFAVEQGSNLYVGVLASASLLAPSTWRKVRAFFW